MHPPESVSGLLSRTPSPSRGAPPRAGYEALSASIRKILQENNLDEVLRTICEEACRVLGADCSLVEQVVSHPLLSHSTLFSHNLQSDFLEACQGHPHSGSILSDVLERRELEVVQDPALDPRPPHAEALQRLGCRTVCVMPLVVSETPFGGLFLYHLTRKDYTPRDRALAAAFGELASLAIEKAHTASALKARVEEQNSLERALRHVVSSLSVSEIVQAVLAESERVMGTDRCSVMLPDPLTGEPRNYVSKGFSPGFGARMAALSVPNPIGRAYLSDPKRATPTIVPNADTHPDFGSVHAAEGHRVLAAFPLRAEERNIGVLFYCWTHPETLGEQKVALGQAFADQVAIAIKNARLLAETDARATRLEIVEKIARTVGSTLEPEEIFRAIVREIRRAVPCERCVVASWKPGVGRFHYWHLESDIEMTPLPEYVMAQEVFSPTVYRTKLPFNIPDIREREGPFAAQFAKAGFQSVLVIPIIREGECIAHLALASTRLRAFTEDHEMLLQSVASHLGTAIRNATLFTRLSVLNEVNRKLNQNLDLSQTLESIAHASVELLKADHTRIFLLDESTQRLFLQATSGSIPPPDERPLAFGVGEGVMGRVFLTGEPAIHEDVRTDPDWIHTDWAREHGIHSYVAQPLRQGDRIFGIINCMSKKRGFFGQEELHLLGALASQASVAIHNARLYEESERQGKRLGTLVEVTQRMTRGLDLTGVLKAISEAAATVFGGEAGFRLLQGEDLVRVGATPGALDAMPLERIRVGESLSGRAAESGQAIISEDLAADPRLLPLHRRASRPDRTGAIMIVPVKVGPRVLGTLNIYRERGHRFDAAALSLATSLADQAAIAIENARLFEEARMRAARLEVTGEIAKAIASTMEPEELFRTITREIRRAIPCDRCVVASVDYGARRHFYHHINSDAEIPSPHPNEFEVAEWFHREVYEPKRARIIPDLREEKLPWTSHLIGAGLRSVLAVPILQGDLCVAHFALSSKQARAFTPGHAELLASIASHIGAAIRNSTLFKEAERRASRLNTLNALGGKIAENLDLQEVLGRIVRAVVELLQGDISRLFLLDEATGNLVPFAHAGRVPPPDSPREPLRLGRGVIGKAIQTGEAAILDDVQEGHDFLYQKWARKNDLHSYIVHPLRHGAKVIGAIHCMSVKRAFFRQEDLELLGSLASQAAIAIQNAHLHEATRARVAELESLQHAVKALTSELQLPDLLSRIADESAGLLGADRCLVTARGEGQEPVRFLYSRGISEKYMNLNREKFDVSIVSKVIMSEKVACWIEDALEDPRYPFGPDAAREEGIRSILAAPLMHQGEVFGALSFYWNAPRRFAPSEVALAQTFADQAAIAIEKARLLAEAQEQAARFEITGEIAKVVASTLEPKEMFQTIVREIRHAVPCDRCVIASLDHKTRRLHYWHIESENEVGAPPTGKWLAEEVYKTHRPLNIPDMLDPQWRQHSRHLTDAGLRSMLFVPILQGGRGIANLALGRKRPNAFSAEEVELLTEVASHLGPALRNATLFHTAEQRASRLATLNELSKKITENLNLSEVLASISSAVVELLRADHCLIFMVEKASSELTLKVSRGIFSDEVPRGLRFRMGEGVTGWTAQNARPALIGQVKNDPRWIYRGWGRAVQSYLSQPIILGGEVIGVIGGFSTVENCFREEDLELVGALASQASIAIQNASLHEEERRSRDFFRSVVKDNADAIVLTNKEGRIVLWNPAAEAHFGYSEGEVLGQPLAKLIVPAEKWTDWKETVGKSAREMIGGGRAFNFEGERRRKDGSLIPVGVTASPVLNDAGEVIAFSSMYKDLTEKKRAEKEREAYVERLKALNMLSQKIGASLDLDEVLDFIVDSAAWLLDVPFAGIYLLKDGKLTLRSFRGWMHSRLKGYDFRIGEGGVGRVAEQGELIYIENVCEDPAWLFRDEASKRGIGSFLGVPLKSDGKVIGMLSSLTLGVRTFSKDQRELITAFANQAAIAVKNAEVHSRLEESFEELRRTQQMMIRTEKLSSLGVLAAGAAHEILNPANIIGIRAQRLAEWSRAGSRENMAAEIIQRNVRRIARICDDLRRFSRDEVLSVELFDPNEAIRDCLALVEHELRQGGIQGELKLAEVGPVVRADRYQIQQVFINLISNARDAMPNGGKLTISSRRAKREGKLWWEARVTDTGEGIPDEILPRIFDPFFTTKPQDKGTGLGLSVSHGIMENHGGRIWAERNPDRGTTLVILLPLVKEEA